MLDQNGLAVGLFPTPLTTEPGNETLPSFEDYHLLEFCRGLGQGKNRL